MRRESRVEMIVARLYAIVDAEVLVARGVGLRAFAEALRAAGVGMVQYRDKSGTVQEVLANASILSEVFRGSGCCLILNDRVDLALLACFDGVHVGQEDLSPEDAAFVLGTGVQNEREGQTGEVARRMVGVSTHTDEQVIGAGAGCADYVAVGPVFATGTKADAAAVVGLEGVRRARALTSKPLVAIGGITRANCGSVMEAGADSVAVISGLLAPGEAVEEGARDFLRILR